MGVQLINISSENAMYEVQAMYLKGSLKCVKVVFKLKREDMIFFSQRSVGNSIFQPETQTNFIQF